MIYWYEQAVLDAIATLGAAVKVLQQESPQEYAYLAYPESGLSQISEVIFANVGRRSVGEEPIEGS